MITYEEQRKLRKVALKLSEENKTSDAYLKKQGFINMKLGNTIILTSPAKQAERLKQGYKFI